MTEVVWCVPKTFREVKVFGLYILISYDVVLSGIVELSDLVQVILTNESSASVLRALVRVLILESE